MPYELSIGGTPFQMGVAHGEHLRSAVRDLATIRIERLASTTANRRLSTASVQAEKAWRNQARVMPEIHDEFEGIRQGAGLNVLEAVAVGGFTDILNGIQAQASVPTECTTLAVERSSFKPRIIGTWDSHPEAAASLTIIRRKPINGPEVVGLTSAGTPIQQGINEEGLAFAINNLRPFEVGDGVVYTSVLSLISGIQNVYAAASAVKSLKFMSGHYYLVMDRNKALGLEASPSGLAILKPDAGGFLAHSNHYLSRTISGYVDANSLERLHYLTQASLSYDGTLESAWKMIQPVEREASTPYLIDNNEDHTCASFIIDVESASVYWKGDIAQPVRASSTINI